MNEDKLFKNNMHQLIILSLIFVLIVVRISCRDVVNIDWIWIVNYAGMFLALFNLLLNKCLELRKTEHKLHNKHKSFTGFTILILITTIGLGVVVGICQSKKIAYCLNDVVTLLALLFSLSQNIWSSILNSIAKKI